MTLSKPNLQQAFLQRLRGEEREIEGALEFCQSLPEQALSDLVGIRLEDPLRFSLTFLKVLDSGGCPVLMPSPEEVADYHLPVDIDEQGLHHGDCQTPPKLKARPESYIAFSSGSTGLRKPLQFDSRRALGNASAHAASLGISSQHHIVQTLRIYHPFGVVAYIFTPLACQASVEMGIFFDSLFPLRREGDLPHHVVHLTPYHLQLLQRRKVSSPHRVGKLTLGAGPVRREEALYALEFCQELYTTYGLSEAGPRVTSGRVDPSRFVDGWIGYPIPEVQARVDDSGCLWLKTPYYADDNSDFFNTRDRLEALPDGSLIFKNRLEDVLRIRGQTYPRQIYNQRLEQLLGLACAVCQRPYSDALVIFIESPIPDSAMVQSIYRHAPELRGAEVHFQEAFDRTALGKVDLPKMLAGLSR